MRLRAWYWMTMSGPRISKPGFFGQVYALVARIPRGKVMTYGQISAALNSICSARYVGYAMASAPDGLALPCHRVVNRFGEMAGGTIFGGPDNQRRTLKNEGVPFTAHGRVNLPACLFNPFPCPQALIENISDPAT